MDILDTAHEFYKKTPLPQVQDQRRKIYTKKLLFVIETAPFLSHSEKVQLANLIPLYTTRVIKQVKRRLIEQGIVFLQLNPNYREPMQSWLDKVSKSTI